MNPIIICQIIIEKAWITQKNIQKYCNSSERNTEKGRWRTNFFEIFNGLTL